MTKAGNRKGISSALDCSFSFLHNYQMNMYPIDHVLAIHRIVIPGVMFLERAAVVLTLRLSIIKAMHRTHSGDLKHELGA